MSPRPVELPEPEFEASLRLARQGRFREALASIERAVASRSDPEPHSTSAATALAEVARLAVEKHDPATAERALELAVRLRPRYADLHYQRACVLLALQRRAEARRSLEEALRANPRFMAARLEHALLDAREGLIGDALESLRSMARDHPVEDPRSFQQGLQSLERAEWDEADSLLKRALSLSDPEFKRQLERFREYLDRGEAARAAQCLREILPHHQGYPDLHYLLGLAELGLGHFDDALVSLARALELNPDYHEARVQLAHALECLGESAEAGSQIALVLRHDPGNVRALELQKRWSERPGYAPALAGRARVRPDRVSEP